MYTAVNFALSTYHFLSHFYSRHIGLKQGDPRSPSLFMLNVNDSLDNINADLRYIFTAGKLKLFFLYYSPMIKFFPQNPRKNATATPNRRRKLLHYMRAKNK